jgi:hypothetical protein
MKARASRTASTASTRATTSSCATSNALAAESSKNCREMKLMAGLVKWHDYDRLMGKIFYEKFGSVVEEKFNRYEQHKNELKESIRQNLGEDKVK